MASVSVTLDGGDELIARLRAMGANVRRELRAAGIEAAQEVEDRANALAPGPHIIHEVLSARQNEVTVAVGPDKEHWYYRFAETGAKPHSIGGGLAFEGDQGLVVTESVQHPGRADKPFLRPALDEGAADATEAMGARLRAVVDAG